MTGHIAGIAPEDATHLTRRDYVDTAVGAVDTDLAAHMADTNNPHLTVIGNIPGLEGELDDKLEQTDLNDAIQLGVY